MEDFQLDITIRRAPPRVAFLLCHISVIFFSHWCHNPAYILNLPVFNVLENKDSKPGT